MVTQFQCVLSSSNISQLLGVYPRPHTDHRWSYTTHHLHTEWFLWIFTIIIKIFKCRLWFRSKLSNSNKHWAVVHLSCLSQTMGPCFCVLSIFLISTYRREISKEKPQRISLWNFKILTASCSFTSQNGIIELTSSLIVTFLNGPGKREFKIRTECWCFTGKPPTQTYLSCNTLSLEYYKRTRILSGSTVNVNPLIEFKSTLFNIQHEMNHSVTFCWSCLLYKYLLFPWSYWYLASAHSDRCSFLVIGTGDWKGFERTIMGTPTGIHTRDDDHRTDDVWDYIIFIIT